MDNTQQVKDVLILGGGTAGWITASLLVRILGKQINITLVESDDIGAIGVGEATIPPILFMNKALGLDENAFIRETQATIKLGIQFENWSSENSQYMHAFGKLGKDFPYCDFHHFWLRARKLDSSQSYWAHSLNQQAATAGSFAQLGPIEGTHINGLPYAYHFNASLYANFLRKYCENLGVNRIEGKFKKANIRKTDGFIDSIELENGNLLKAELFIDCSGFRALLSEGSLKTPYLDWSDYLICDNAIAAQCDDADPTPIPYTKSIAHAAGWRWRIPVQGRVGNGWVYSSKFMDKEKAETEFRNSMENKPHRELRHIPFRTGARKKAWNKNCISIGLSSGFIEPLESTSIHLIQTAILRLIRYFPNYGIQQAEVERYNQLTLAEMEHARDFIMLHYALNNRPEPFWKHCREISLPDSLTEKMRLFKSSGRVHMPNESLFANIAWVQVMLGQEYIPENYHPLADAVDEEQLLELMKHNALLIQRIVGRLPTHQNFLDSVKK